MSDKKTQAEQDAEEVAAWKLSLETHDNELRAGLRTWHFTHYMRPDPEQFIRASLRTIDRKDAEIVRLRALLEGMTEILTDASWGSRVAGNIETSRAAHAKIAAIRAALNGEAGE